MQPKKISKTRRKRPAAAVRCRFQIRTGLPEQFLECLTVGRPLPMWPEPCFDGHKKVKGRKRHIVVDTLGLILVAVVTAANQHDSKAARSVMKKLAKQSYPRLKTLLGDSAYGKKLRKWAKQNFGFVLKVVKVTELLGFQVIPVRWKVERTFAWQNRGGGPLGPPFE